MGRVGAEFGATTGRKRRCGWLDLVMLRYAVRVNGLSSLALSKLDVLTGLPELKICRAYRLDGQNVTEMPASTRALGRCEPVYDTVPGWSGSIEDARTLEDLPPEARDYLARIEDAIEVRADFVGVGAERDATIERANPFDL